MSRFQARKVRNPISVVLNTPLNHRHKITDATVIPGTVTAQLSLRLVPDQDLDTIVKSLRDYLQKSFNSLQSPNKLVVCPITVGTVGNQDKLSL